jgi:hypothetical protein
VMLEFTTLINDRPCVNTYLMCPMARFIRTEYNEGRIARFSSVTSSALYDVSCGHFDNFM